MDATTLLIGLMAGSIGAGYFIYGKKQQKAVPIIAGLGLCFVPYFIGNTAISIGVCVLLIVSPFVLKD